MQNKDRAKIFMPFDALNGFREALRDVERVYEEKKELSSDIFEELNEKIKALNISDLVTIKHYYDEIYIETTGIVKKIDKYKKLIYIDNSIISFDDIIQINKKYN